MNLLSDLRAAFQRLPPQQKGALIGGTAGGVLSGLGSYAAGKYYQDVPEWERPGMHAHLPPWAAGLVGGASGGVSGALLGHRVGSAFARSRPPPPTDFAGAPPPMESYHETLRRSFDPARHGKVQRAWEAATRSEPHMHGMAPTQVKDAIWFMQNVGRTARPADMARMQHIVSQLPQDSHLQTIMRQAFERHHGTFKQANLQGRIRAWRCFFPN